MAARRGSPTPLSDTAEDTGDQVVVPKRIKIEEAATELVAAPGEGSNVLSAAPTTKIQPLGPITRCSKVIRRTRKPAPKDPRRDLPTVVKPKDPDTAENVASSRDKALVRDAARSTVSIFITAPDGKVIDRCTGIFIGWKETKKCARVLTGYDIARRLDPKNKLHIGLPNRTVLEGQLLFFNEHYDISLLEISSDSDLPLQLPSFGSNPNYGQEVFILARGEESNLMARHGRILWLEDTEDFARNHLMFLSCEPPEYATGGPVIDHDGSATGMAFDNGDPKTSILAISTILTCIEMWMKFSRVARPIHGLSLVELLEVSLQEVLSLDHNIDNGYIVDMVSFGSTAKMLGIRYGDVIVSFDGLRLQTLPQLEDYLLSLGWRFLQGNTDSSSTIDLKLEVYDPLERGTRSITLSAEFCDASE